MTPRQRLFGTLTLFAIGLLIGMAYSGFSTPPSGGNASQGTAQVPMVNGASIGGPFTLIDGDGKTRTEKDFAATYKLIYFGFTYCPAICPTELQKTAEAMKELPSEIAAQIQPIFITIDPERDTPKVVKNYTPLFDKKLIGLTGSVDQIEAIKKTYKVYAAKVPQDDTYTMDHSSYIYFMTPDDKPVYMFRTKDTAETMAQTLTAYFTGKPAN